MLKVTMIYLKYRWKWRLTQQLSILKIVFLSILRVGVYRCVEHYFQQYFFVVVYFITGGNQNTPRTLSTCRKSPRNLITWCCIKYNYECESTVQTLVVIDTDWICKYKPNNDTITTRRYWQHLQNNHSSICRWKSRTSLYIK